jgi:hypothetical protein
MMDLRIESQKGETPGTLEFDAALGSVPFVLDVCNAGIGPPRQL